MNPPRVYMCSQSWTPLPPASPNLSLGHPRAPAPSIMYHASKLDWRFISYMILYMFQCHSPKSSHLLPLPQRPKDCSIHLCLFCCLAYRVIITICHEVMGLEAMIFVFWMFRFFVCLFVLEEDNTFSFISIKSQHFLFQLLQSTFSITLQQASPAPTPETEEYFQILPQVKIKAPFQ